MPSTLFLHLNNAVLLIDNRGFDHAVEWYNSLMGENYDDLYKIILAGDAYVGKTNLVYRFVKSNNDNAKNIAPTVGV